MSKITINYGNNTSFNLSRDVISPLSNLCQENPHKYAKFTQLTPLKKTLMLDYSIPNILLQNPTYLDYINLNLQLMSRSKDESEIMLTKSRLEEHLIQFIIRIEDSENKFTDNFKNQFNKQLPEEWKLPNYALNAKYFSKFLVLINTE